MEKFKYYYKTANGEVFEINEDCKKLNINCGNVIEVTLPPNLEILDCVNNQLKSIVCNENLRELTCFNNQLTEIILNKKLLSLHCTNNQLKTLICNENLVTLFCINNQLKTLICNENLKALYCNNVYHLINCLNNEYLITHIFN